MGYCCAGECSGFVQVSSLFDFLQLVSVPRLELLETLARPQRLVALTWPGCDLGLHPVGTC